MGLINFRKVVANSLVLVTSVVISEAEATESKHVIGHGTQRLTLTASEFQRLSPQKKQQWIEALRHFMASVEKIEHRSSLIYSFQEATPIGIFSWLRVKSFLPKMCHAAGFVLYSPESKAENSTLPPLRYITGNSYRNRKVAEYFEAQLKIDEAKRALGKNVSSDEKFELERALWEATTDRNNSLAFIRSEDAKRSSEFRREFHEDPERYHIDQAKAKYELAIAIAENDKAKASSAREALRMADENYAASVRRDKAAEADRDANGPPLYPGVDMNKLSCIYAGWVQDRIKKEGAQSSECPAPTKKTLVDKDNKEITFSCESAPNKAVANANLFRGDNNKGQDRILCNPLIFGYFAEGKKPICVSGGANASLACKAKAGLEREKLVDAKIFSNEFSKEFDDFSDRIHALCAITYKPGYFRQLGFKTQEEALKSGEDMKGTCSELKEHLFAVESSANGFAQPATGGQ